MSGRFGRKSRVNPFEVQQMIDRCKAVAREVVLAWGELTFQAALDIINDRELTPDGVTPERFAAMVAQSNKATLIFQEE